MISCLYCSRPANTKVVFRDEWERVREIFVCDKHDKTLGRAAGEREPLSQKEMREKKGWD